MLLTPHEWIPYAGPTAPVDIHESGHIVLVSTNNTHCITNSPLVKVNILKKSRRKCNLRVSVSPFSVAFRSSFRGKQRDS